MVSVPWILLTREERNPDRELTRNKHKKGKSHEVGEPCLGLVVSLTDWAEDERRGSLARAAADAVILRSGERTGTARKGGESLHGCAQGDEGEFCKRHTER